MLAKPATSRQPFWVAKNPEDLTSAEWESLCDGCGLCCLEKVVDEDSGELLYTNTPCRFFDLETCRCNVYTGRLRLNPACSRITPTTVGRLPWLPHTCAYRIIYETRSLPPWHHLVCDDLNAVHHAAVSVKSRTAAGLFLVPGFGLYLESDGE